MNRKRLFQLLNTGEPLSAADVTALNLPAVASAASAYVTAKYVPLPQSQRVILTLAALPVVVANTTGISFGSKQLLDFAQGRIRIEGGTADLVITFGATIATAGSGDASIGTTATADGVLSTTEVDIMASTAMLDPFVLQVGTLKGVMVKDTEFDGTATAKDAFLNIIVDDTDVSDGGSETVLVSGTIILDVAFSGDY